MKVRLTTPDRMIVSFTRRETSIIGNSLKEACSGLIKDRFVLAYDDLSEMLAEVREIDAAQDFFRLKAAAP